MARRAEVWTWLLNDLDRFEDEDDTEHYFHWREREYVTDVFNRRDQPPVGSVLVGYETTRGAPTLRTLGQVASYSGVATGRVRATVRPLFHHMATPLSEVARRLPNSHRGQVRELFVAQSLQPVKVSQDKAGILIEALSRAVAGSKKWLDAVRGEKLRVYGNTGYRLREERDAIQTAISFTGLELKQPIFEPSSPSAIRHAAQLLNSKIFDDNEDDLIFADLRKFDRGGVLAHVSGSSSVYRDNRITLMISNVNRKPLERALGVDLLYWDVDRNTYTFMQYKRLKDAGQRYEISLDPNADDKWRYTDKSD